MTPNTPAANSPGRSPRLSGTTPPQNPTSIRHWPAAAARFVAKAAADRVGGNELSGMSSRVVTPPVPAAVVAVAKPSQCVRPGSFTCTWVSTTPGISTTSGPSSTVRAPDSTVWSSATITPLRTATVAGRSAPSSTARAARMTRSSVMPQYGVRSDLASQAANGPVAPSIGTCRNVSERACGGSGISS